MTREVFIAIVLMTIALIGIWLTAHDTFYRMFPVTESDDSFINLNRN